MKFIEIIFFLITIHGYGQLRLANIFSDNMVLQRNWPIHFWGKSNPGNIVQIRFSGEQKKVVAHSDSSWSIYFNKQKTNTKPQSIIIVSGKDKIEIKNILIGDIWICSGQSNMEFPMQKEMHFKEESLNANQPLIRFINPLPAGRYVYGVTYTDSLKRRLIRDSFYLWSGWQVCDSNTIKPMSAVGYYFAKSIVSKKNIPIGLINLSIGGAPIETFISREAMEKSKQFAGKVKPGDWLENDALPAWIRERGKQNIANSVNGYKDDFGLNHAYKPGFAFQCGIEPILPFPVKGIIWYQGESNSLEETRVNEYKNLLHLMVDDYRKKWKEINMPFYWVQLSSIDTANYKSQYWPKFRNEQRVLLNEIKNGGMAVCSDIGFKNDVHPTNKKDVGERLARWALKKNYNERITPSGPLPLKAIYKNGEIIISFQYSDGVKTSDGKALRGFSVDGKTENEAIIKNKKVIVKSKQKPQYIYYGWKPFSDANLVNSENLPASTFKIKITGHL
jgi:sialate O-acetylesterase